MYRDECLLQGIAAVSGSRQVAHGAPEDTFERIARLWSAYLVNKWPILLEGEALTEADAALMQGLVKMARLQGNPGHTDSWVDLAGYAACGCECATADDDPS